MPLMPAECPRCHRVFEPDGGIEIVDGRDITISDNTITCPYCGADADFLEGTFDVRGVVLELVTGPPRTHEALRKLAAAVHEAQTLVESDPARAAVKLADAAPSLAKRIWDALGSGQLALIVAILLYILPALTEESPPSAEEIAQQVVEQLQRAEREADAPPEP